MLSFFFRSNIVSLFFFSQEISVSMEGNQPSFSFMPAHYLKKTNICSRMSWKEGPVQLHKIDCLTHTLGQA